jgi:transposase-like protein
MRLLEQIAAGDSSQTAAELVGVNRNTSILYFYKLKEIIPE